jgi:mono/diheme cytochrome c family protein
MRLATGFFWLSVLVVAGCSTTPGEAQTRSATPVAAVEPMDNPTIWDGVFTASQADRGEQVARANCFSCHGQREWATPTMIPIWSGRPIRDFYENLRATMPYDSPGRLTRQEYADVLSYILELNGAPPGDTPLPSDEEGLAQIQVTIRENP